MGGISLSAGGVSSSANRPARAMHALRIGGPHYELFMNLLSKTYRNSSIQSVDRFQRVVLIGIEQSKFDVADLGIHDAV